MKKTKAKLFTSVLVGTLLLSGVVQGNSLITNVTSTINEQITMKWNGERFTPKEDNGEAVHPLVFKGRTYLPIRFVAEKAGVNVEWDNTTKTVVFNQKLNNAENQKVTSRNQELEKQVSSLQKENNNLKSQNKDAEYSKQIKELNNEIKNLKDKNEKLQEIEKQQKINDKQELEKQQAIDKKVKEQERLKQQQRDKELRDQESRRKLEDARRKANDNTHYITGQGETSQGTGRPSTNGSRGGWYIDASGKQVWKSY